MMVMLLSANVVPFGPVALAKVTVGGKYRNTNMFEAIGWGTIEPDASIIPTEMFPGAIGD